jgi:protein-disulfide isomerase
MRWAEAHDLFRVLFIFFRSLYMKKIFFFLLVLLSAFFSTSVQAEPQTISQSEVSQILSAAAIEGNTGATITLVVYSDMECPFCIMLHNKIALWKNVNEKYQGSVNFIYKNNR